MMESLIVLSILGLTLYIKTTKGYTPKGTENKIKYIDSSHTIKRNLLLRIK